MRLRWALIQDGNGRRLAAVLGRFLAVRLGKMALLSKFRNRYFLSAGTEGTSLASTVAQAQLHAASPM